MSGAEYGGVSCPPTTKSRVGEAVGEQETGQRVAAACEGVGVGASAQTQRGGVHAARLGGVRELPEDVQPGGVEVDGDQVLGAQRDRPQQGFRAAAEVDPGAHRRNLHQAGQDVLGAEPESELLGVVAPPVLARIGDRGVRCGHRLGGGGEEFGEPAMAGQGPHMHELGGGERVSDVVDRQQLQLDRSGVEPVACRVAVVELDRQRVVTAVLAAAPQDRAGGLGGAEPEVGEPHVSTSVTAAPAWA